MSRLIVLYNYNKYYNRIIKRKSSFQDYVNLITAPNENTPAQYKGFIRENMNFDYQDGVYAQHVINIKETDPDYCKIEHPDYCVLEETYVQGEGDNAVTTTKLSRYFIIDVTKVRGNQFQYSMRRDLLSDHFDDILLAPVFIEKGSVQNFDDPAIFNKESMTLNQIKKGELKLTQTKLSGKAQGWVVGYIAPEDIDNPTPISDCVGKVELPELTPNYDDLPANLKAIITAGTYEDYDGYAVDMYFPIYMNSSVGRRGQIYRDNGVTTGGIVTVGTYGGYTTGALIKTSSSYNESLAENACRTNYFDNILLSANSVFNSENPDVYNKISDLQNSYNGFVYQKNGKLYKVTITRTGSREWIKRYTAAQVTSGSDTLSTQARIYLNALAFTDYFDSRTATSTEEAFEFRKLVDIYVVTTAEVAFNELKCDIPANRNKNADAPYDIFCIPLGVLDVYNGTTKILTTAENIALPMARAIATKGTSARIFDVQILPYCPFEEIIKSDGDINISGFTEHTDYEYIVNEVSGVSTNVGIILFPKYCRGTFDITLDSDVDIYNYIAEERNSIIEKKLKSETNLIRFVSPNYASTFEINAQKNKGITSINVDYFYKPYTPYIHVAPYFNGLYGQDFNDPKGLICSGEFSIATSSSKWEEYQIQNKNFELIFNRQIENLDVNNSLAYQVAELSSGIGVATSTLTGLGAGAAAGAMIGSMAGPVGTLVGAGAGAIVGGLAGGLTSGLGRKYDLEYMRKSQSEARSYAVDMYAYNLGNIKALPYTLTRVSSFTPNNKIFPFIEVYDCTSEEKEALRNKLIYNGMTIMRIGKISDFIGNEIKYVSGQLIRLVGMDEDSHVVAEIAQEIKEGAYYYGNDSE